MESFSELQQRVLALIRQFEIQETKATTIEFATADRAVLGAAKAREVGGKIAGRLTSEGAATVFTEFLGLKVVGWDAEHTTVG